MDENTRCNVVVCPYCLSAMSGAVLAFHQAEDCKEAIQAENARLIKRVQELEEERREICNKPPRERFYCRGCTLPGIESRLAEAEGLLEELEFVLMPTEYGAAAVCPVCYGTEDDSIEGFHVRRHIAGCRLAAFLHPEKEKPSDEIDRQDAIQARLDYDLLDSGKD